MKIGDLDDGPTGVSRRNGSGWLDDRGGGLHGCDLGHCPSRWRLLEGSKAHSPQVCNQCEIATTDGSCMLSVVSELGIRERKKQRTRQALRQAALELFLERGFEATTIADITAAADVAPRTFFSYFQAKEDVVLD